MDIVGRQAVSQTGSSFGIWVYQITVMEKKWKNKIKLKTSKIVNLGIYVIGCRHWFCRCCYSEHAFDYIYFPRDLFTVYICVLQSDLIDLAIILHIVGKHRFALLISPSLIKPTKEEEHRHSSVVSVGTKFRYTNRTKWKFKRTSTFFSVRGLDDDDIIIWILSQLYGCVRVCVLSSEYAFWHNIHLTNASV